MLLALSKKIHSIIMSKCLEQNHTTPLPRGPQITPELEMRNIAFFQTACLSEGAERAFSSKAKLWSLWSVGHVAEEMLIMWLCAGLVCCDLEGSSHGATGLGEMRGVTTGTALGKKKAIQTLSNCAFSLPSFGLAYPNTFQMSQEFDTYYSVSPSVWLCLNPLSFLFLPAHLNSAFSTAKPQDFCLLSLCMLQSQGSLCELYHQ